MTRSANRGLSQLEMLVALAVMAIIMVMLANAFTFVRIGLDRAGSTQAAIEDAVNREQFRSFAEAMGTTYGKGTARDLLEGTGERITLRTTIPDQADGGSEDVTLELSLQNADAASVVIAAPLINGTGQASAAAMVLARDARSLEITYFGRPTDQPEPGWHAAWSDPTYLPDLVKIEITRVDGTPLPPLVFEPAKTERQSRISLSSLLPPD